jgi:hypothetical protein
MRIVNLLFFMLFSLPLFAQQMPNGSFETWTQTGNYAEPNGWNSPNPTTASLGTYTVTKESSVVQLGSAAAKIQTKSVLGIQIPGLLTLGTFSINLVTMEAKIEGGTPFTSRPTSMTGYYQYEPKFGDECFIGVLLLKQNGTSWDTLGTGSFASTTTKLAWTPFEINIDYTAPDDPTHLNIIILSSDRNNPQPNSTLYVDNLSFSYDPTGISDISSQTPSISWADGKLIVNAPASSLKSSVINLFSSEGRLMYSETISENSNYYESQNLSSLPAGIYIANITALDNGKSTTRKLLIIPKN